jgi:hypothetical protein
MQLCICTSIIVRVGISTGRGCRSTERFKAQLRPCIVIPAAQGPDQADHVVIHCAGNGWTASSAGSGRGLGFEKRGEAGKTEIKRADQVLGSCDLAA